MCDRLHSTPIFQNNLTRVEYRSKIQAKKSPRFSDRRLETNLVLLDVGSDAFAQPDRLGGGQVDVLQR